MMTMKRTLAECWRMSISHVLSSLISHAIADDNVISTGKFNRTYPVVSRLIV